MRSVAGSSRPRFGHCQPTRLHLSVPRAGDSCPRSIPLSQSSSVIVARAARSNSASRVINGMSSHHRSRCTTPKMDGSSRGQNGRRVDGMSMRLTPLREIRFSACPEFASTTPIQAISGTSGKGIRPGALIGSATSLTAFTSDSMTPRVNGQVSDILRYLVPRGIVAESARSLRSLSDGRREGVVLWTGSHQEGEALVRRIVVPRQHASDRVPGSGVADGWWPRSLARPV